jgi:hypothetical protein
MFEEFYPASVIETHDSYLSMLARTKDSSTQFSKYKGHFESGKRLMERNIAA